VIETTPTPAARGRRLLLAPRRELAQAALTELAAQAERVLAQPTTENVASAVQFILEGTKALQALANAPAGDDAKAASETRHAIRNQLTVVLGYADRLARRLRESEPGPLTADLDLLRALAHEADQALGALVHALRNADPPTEDDLDHRGVLDWMDATTGHTPLTGQVLVVEDFLPASNLLADTLRGLGLKVHTVSNGPDALAAVAANRFDLVLLDVLLPGMNGLTVLARLKADPATRDLPVLMVSGAGESDLSVRCITLGAEDFLPKPPQLPLLRARVGSCLEKYRLRRRYAEVLHAVLPAHVAEPYLRDGRWPAPDRHDNIAVLFADIAGFTAYCDHTDPAVVAGNLADLFPTFDGLAARHGVQKIKTIGDAFMAVAGLMDPINQPVLRCVRLGLDILREVARFPREKPGWRARVGVHVGPVVAGVLGQTRFVYDLWGDTVNFAARMESNGRENCVNLSTAAWVHLAARFPAAEHSHKIVKGKEGETIIYHISALTPEVTT
jgi:adenylate cyclase